MWQIFLPQRQQYQNVSSSYSRMYIVTLTYPFERWGPCYLPWPQMELETVSKVVEVMLSDFWGLVLKGNTASTSNVFPSFVCLKIIAFGIQTLYFEEAPATGQPCVVVQVDSTNRSSADSLYQLSDMWVNELLDYTSPKSLNFSHGHPRKTNHSYCVLSSWAMKPWEIRKDHYCFTVLSLGVICNIALSK